MAYNTCIEKNGIVNTSYYSVSVDIHAIYVTPDEDENTYLKTSFRQCHNPFHTPGIA